VQALLEQTAENLEALQRIISRGEEGRVASNQALVALTERMGTVAEALQRLSGELSVSQAQLATDLRQEMRLVARMIAGRVDERAP
jgi:hypothetical protein